jgi:hypothetical protein
VILELSLHKSTFAKRGRHIDSNSAFEEVKAKQREAEEKQKRSRGEAEEKQKRSRREAEEKKEKKVPKSRNALGPTKNPIPFPYSQ